MSVTVPGCSLETSILNPPPCRSTPPVVQEPERELEPFGIGILTGFEEGFDSLTDNQWNENRPIVSEVRAGIQTTKALYLADAASRITKDSSLSVSAGSSIYIRVYFKFTETSSGVQDLNYEILSTATSGGTDGHILYLLLNNNDVAGQHRMYLVTDFSPLTIVKSTVNLQQNTWYRLNVECRRNLVPDGFTKVDLYLNGALTDSITGVHPTNAGNNINRIIRLGHTISGGGDVNYWFDDLLVTSIEDYVRESTVYTLPFRHEVQTDFTPVGASTNLEAVNGVPGPPGVDNATYNESIVNGHIDRFSIDTSELDVQQTVDYTQVTGYANWTGLSASQAATFDLWDNFDTQYSQSIGIFFAPFAVFLPLMKWNDIPVIQFSNFNVGYEVTNHGVGSGSIRVLDQWINANVTV